MEENMNAVNENIISQDADTQQGVDTETGTDTATQDGTKNVDTSAQGGENTGTAEGDTPEAPYLEIKYNHEKKGLTRDEAITWAQKGMYYENSLERAAALKGVPVDEFLKNLETAEDEAYRQSLIEKFGNDEEVIGGMMELYEIRKQKALDSAKETKRLEAEAREQSANERIAKEFTAMKKDFPELTEYSKLPEAVKQAASEGMPLAYAYLLHQHTENQKINAAKNQAAAAEKHSAGTLGSADTPDMVGDAFLKGILGK